MAAHQGQVKPWRERSKNDRLAPDGFSRPTRLQMDDAIELVDRAGIAEALDRELGRSQHLSLRLSVKAYEVVHVLRGRTPGHRATTADRMRIMNSLSKPYLKELGSPDWTQLGGYDVLHRLERRIDDWMLNPGKGDWYQDALIRASFDESKVRGSGLAVDATAVETSAVIRGSREQLLASLDGGNAQASSDNPQSIPHFDRQGRAIFTKDPNALIGRRSATGKSSAGPFAGYHLHIGVSSRGLESTNGVDQIRLSRKPPAFILFLRLVPANTSPADTVLMPVANVYEQHGLTHVVIDRGYSGGTGFLLDCRRHGIDVCFDLKSTQRGIENIGDFMDVVDGHPMSSHMPRDLVALPEPFGAARSGRADVEAMYNDRARWRWSRHQNGKDGTFRMRDAFGAGRLKSIGYPQTLRNANSVPDVAVKHPPVDGKPRTRTIDADGLPLIQSTLYGTTAHRKLYGTRNQVENVNGQLARHTDFGAPYQPSFSFPRRQRSFAHLCAAHNHIESKRYTREEALTSRDNERKKRSDARRGWSEIDWNVHSLRVTHGTAASDTSRDPHD